MADNTSAFDERAMQIEQEFDYDGYQIVRREMFAHQREPAVTVRGDSISFNTACIDGLEDAIYIHIMVNEDQKRMVIRKCEENDKDAIRWCVARPDKRRSRMIKGRFSQKLFNMMQWVQGCRYKIMGHKINYKGEVLYVFELEECEIFRERPKRTKAEREERAKSMTPEELKEADNMERRASMIPYSPTDSENTFGTPVDKHINQIQLESMDGFKDLSMNANALDGGGSHYGG